MHPLQFNQHKGFLLPNGNQISRLIHPSIKQQKGLGSKHNSKKTEK